VWATRPVEVEVTSPPEFKTNDPQPSGAYRTGVSGQLTITLTKAGKPMINVPVRESVTQQTTKNGKPEPVNLVTNPEPVPTSSTGQMVDRVGLEYTTAKPVPPIVAGAIKKNETENVYTKTSTQTLSFPGKTVQRVQPRTSAH